MQLLHVVKSRKYTQYQYQVCLITQPLGIIRMRIRLVRRNMIKENPLISEKILKMQLQCQ